MASTLVFQTLNKSNFFIFKFGKPTNVDRTTEQYVHHLNNYFNNIVSLMRLGICNVQNKLRSEEYIPPPLASFLKIFSLSTMHQIQCCPTFPRSAYPPSTTTSIPHSYPPNLLPTPILHTIPYPKPYLPT